MAALGLTVFITAIHRLQTCKLLQQCVKADKSLT
jgi:hypothetical protein